MTYELPISSAMYSMGGSAYIEGALETNHHSGVREEKDRSAPTRLPDHSRTRRRCVCSRSREQLITTTQGKQSSRVRICYFVL
jgi:hypothetical protein